MSEAPTHTVQDRPVSSKADWLVYTDAEGDGGVGLYAVDNATGEQFVAKSQTADDWCRRFIPRGNSIKVFETAAVAWAVRTLGSRIRGKAWRSLLTTPHA